MIQLKKAQTKLDYKNIKKLYKIAFPKCERKPFKTILKLNNKNVCDIFIITDKDSLFYGLAITIKYKDLALLDYLAISEDFRGQGVGSKALKLIQNYYKSSRLIIEIEDTSSNNAKNILQRIKRKSFYLKNNMVLQKYKICLLGCYMEMLTFNGDVSFEEYHEIFKAYYPAKIYNRITLNIN